MAASRELDEPARHLRSLASLVKHPAVGDRHRGIVDRMGEVDRRRMLRHLLLVGEQFQKPGVGTLPEKVRARARVPVPAHRHYRVDEDREVGARGFLFDRIGGLGVAVIKVGGGGGGQMPPCRKAHDADAAGIDLPGRGVGPDGAEGTGGVSQRHERPAFGQPVFQDHPGDSVCIEPGCDSVPLRPGDEAAIAASGANHDRRAGLSLCPPGREMNGDEGVGLFGGAVAGGTDRRRSMP